jgi:hypothetical protein
MFDLLSSAVACYVASYGNQQSQGQHAVSLKGTALTTVEIAKGSVGIAELEGESANITTLIIGWVTNIQGDSNVTIGNNVTLTDLVQSAGKCLLRSGVSGSVTVDSGAELTKEGSDTIPTLTIRQGGFACCNGGDITDLHLYGKCDLSRDQTSRTITTVHIHDGAPELITNDNIAITNAFNKTNYHGSNFKWTNR